MRKMKQVTAVLLAVVMAMSFVACGKTEEQPGAAEQPAAPAEENTVQTPAEVETPAEAEKVPVTIQFMHSMVQEERQQVIQDLIDKFQNKYPWITVEQSPTDGDAYDDKLSALAGGSMPAVIEVNQNRAKWLVGEEFADMDAIKEVIESKPGEYYDAILKINTSEDGENYIGVPVG